MRIFLNLVSSVLIFLAFLGTGAAVGCLPYFIGMLIESVRTESGYGMLGWISCFVTIPIFGITGMYISAVVIDCLWNPDDGETDGETKSNEK